MAARTDRYEEARDYQTRVKSALEQFSVPLETAAGRSQVEGDLEVTMGGLEMCSDIYSRAFGGQPSNVRTQL